MRKARGQKEDDSNAASTNHPHNDKLVLHWSNIALSNRLDHMKLSSATIQKQVASAIEAHSAIFSSFFVAWKALSNKLSSNQPNESPFVVQLNTLTDIIDACIKSSNPNSTNHASIVAEIERKVNSFMKSIERLFEEKAESNSTQQTTSEKQILKENHSLKARLTELEKQVYSSKLKVQLLEDRVSDLVEMNEFVSMRLRQAMDYQSLAIGSKTGPVPSNLQQLLEKIPSKRNAHAQSSSANSSSVMEIEAPVAAITTHECVCGGQQFEYFSNIYEDAIEKILAAQTKLVAVESTAIGSGSLLITSSTHKGDVVVASSSNEGTITAATNMATNTSGNASAFTTTGSALNASSVSGSTVDALKTIGGSVNNNQAGTTSGSTATTATTIATAGAEGTQNSSTAMAIEGNNNALTQQQLQTPQQVVAVVTSQWKMSLEEEVVLLRRQKEQLIEEKVETEQLLRSLELDRSNLDDKFFHSALYASLSAQTAELLRSALTAKAQLRDTTRMLSDIERLRFAEVNEILNKSHEEQTELLKNLNAVKEDVYKNQLSEIMQSTLSQYFDYKKYMEPQQEQIAQLSKSVDLLRQNGSELKEMNVNLQSANVAALKQIAELQAKVQESQASCLHLESLVAAAGETSSFVDDKNFKYPKQKETLKVIETMLMKATNMPDQQMQLKNFRELVAYVKGREEKIVAIEAKLKESENDRKKLQGSIDEIWKDYESLDASFAALKKGFDFQTNEMKKHAEREQELETKNLEMNMKLQKEHHAQKVLIVAEQAKQDTAKSAIEALKEQNTQLTNSTADAKNLLEEFKMIYAAVKAEAEDANCRLLDFTVQMSLLSKKYDDLLKVHTVLVADHERTKMKLRDAYDVLDNNEAKQKNVAEKEDTGAMTIDQQKIQNLTSLLQCSCRERIKDVILQKCLHPFCRQCIEKQNRLRQRTCPKCRTPFGMNDIKTLYLSN